jgi:hypothetical protein
MLTNLENREMKATDYLNPNDFKTEFDDESMNRYNE